MTAGQWYRVAATHDGVTMRLYVNGVLENFLAVGVSAAPSTYPAQIGGNIEQGYWFPGAMDDVRLYGNPLSAPAITDVMNGLSPLLPPGGLATTPPTLAITVESENDLVVLQVVSASRPHPRRGIHRRPHRRRLDRAARQRDRHRHQRSH